MSLQDRLHTLRSQLAQAAEVFDETGYCRRYNLPVTVDAVRHYLEDGAVAGCEPNPLFVGAYYSEAYKLPVNNARTPLEHFMSEGLSAGLSPHPLFDAAYYAKDVPETARSGLPLYLHFLRKGLHEDYSCTPLFNPRWYRQSYGYFQFEQLPPFIHYLTSGYRTDNCPNELFDIRWYKSMYGPPSTPGLDSLTEFVWRDQAAYHMPNALFDTWFYCDQYPDVMERGGNPLADYLIDGWKKGRFPNPLFDSQYYNDRYTDVAEAGVNPLGHYLHYGCRERRDPSGLFSTRFYLSQIPNAARTIENPLLHYIWEGCLRGINPHPAFDTATYRASHKLTRHSNPLINLIYQKRDSSDRIDAPMRADGTFISRELSRNGVWPDGWCERDVSLSFITSTLAQVSFNLWSPMMGQSVRVEVEGETARQIDLPAEELVEVRVPIRMARRKATIRLTFGTARALTDSDPRTATALIKNIHIKADTSIRPLRETFDNVQSVQAGRGLLAMTGDLFWTLRYARHYGLKSAVKKFAAMRHLRTAEFDIDYYLKQEPFTGTPRTDPVRHYVLFGADRHLDPIRGFSTRFYTEANDDVHQSGVNPYQHFLKYGQAEGRRSEPSDPAKKKMTT